MRVTVTLRAPDNGELFAIIRIDEHGNTYPLGYLNPGCIPPVVATLKELHAKVEGEGHPSWRTVAAWEEFIQWAQVVAELPEFTEPTA